MKRKRQLLALATLALAGTLLFSSAAAPTGPSDQIHENLSMQPYPGPNGGYAVMEDGELALRFDSSNPNVDGSGVDADAVTQVDRVFEIEYSGDQTARVWLSTDVPGVSFYRGTDQSDSLIGADNAVVLGPDEKLVVGVLIDTRGAADVTSGDQFTVHGELAEDTPTEQPAGESGSGYTLGSVPSGGPGTPTGTPTPTWPSGGSGESGPHLVVTNATLSNATAAVGESVTVNATVANLGDVGGSTTVALYANDTRIANASVTVPAGEDRTVRFDPAFDAPGTNGLRVENESAGTLRVVERAQLTGTPGNAANDVPAADQPNGGSAAWWWVLGAVVVIGALAGAYKLFAAQR